MRDWKNTEAAPGMAAYFYHKEKAAEGSWNWYTVVGEVLEANPRWIRVRVIYSDTSAYEVDTEHMLNDATTETLELVSMEKSEDRLGQVYAYEYGPQRQYFQR